MWKCNLDAFLNNPGRFGYSCIMSRRFPSYHSYVKTHFILRNEIFQVFRIFLHLMRVRHSMEKHSLFNRTNQTISQKKMNQKYGKFSLTLNFVGSEVKMVQLGFILINTLNSCKPLWAFWKIPRFERIMKIIKITLQNVETLPKNIIKNEL